MSETEKTPLARLVLLMVFLSIAGSLVAGVHYYGIDLPQQKALSEHPPANPANSNTREKCETCLSHCNYILDENYYQCLLDCEIICD